MFLVLTELALACWFTVILTSVAHTGTTVGAFAQGGLPDAVPCAQADVCLSDVAGRVPVEHDRCLVRIADNLLTVHAKGEYLEQVLHVIERKAGIRVVLDAKTDESVTIELNGVPLADGLRRILRGKNFMFRYSKPSSAASIPTLTEVLVFVRADTTVGPERRIVEADPDWRDDVERLSNLLLEDDEAEQRRKAAEDLGRTWSVDAVDPLSRALAQDEDPSVREAASRALGQTWSEEAVGALGKTLMADPDSSVREAAARALGETWSDAAVSPLVRALRADPQAAVRGAAARTLGDLGDARAVGPLVHALDDGSAVVREGAAKALGTIGGFEAVEPLLRASWADDDPWVRETAARSAHEISRTER